MRIGVLALVAFGALSAPTARAQDWQSIATGVELLERTDPGPNRVHALRIDLCAPGVRIRATRYDERAKRTSDWGPAAGVVAAINGGFFVPGNPSQLDGGFGFGVGEQWPGSADTAQRAHVAFGPNQWGLSTTTEVLPAAPAWFEDVVSGDALLVNDGAAIYGYGGVCPSRNPLTAVGFSADRTKAFFVVVDGRQTSSVGMTCNEMSDLMISLGAAQALRLDGGGSSAMWVRDRGLISRPSDSGGERIVANHLGVLASGEGAPRNCTTRAVPSPENGVRRRLPMGDALASWKFNLFDPYRMDDAVLASYQDGPPLPDGPPVLVQEAGGDGVIHLLDGDRVRAISNPTALSAWRFGGIAATTRTSAEWSALVQGVPLLDTPVLVLGGNPAEVFLLDTRDTSSPSTSSDGGTPTMTPDPGAGRGLSGGCAVARRHVGATAWIHTGMLLALFRVRRLLRRR